MKWFQPLVFCLAFLVGCANAQPVQEQPQSLLLQNYYSWEDQVIDDMTYRVYFKWRDTSQTGYCIAVVNVTKDKLEVAKLQKELTAAK